MEVLLAISAITDPILKQKVDKSLALLRRTFALYAPSAVALSFNGGKDSTVLLHLVRAALAQWLQQQQTVEVPLAPTAPPAATPDSNGRAANGVAVPANGAAAEHRVRSFFFERDDDFEEIVEFVRRTDERYSLCTDVLVEKDFKAGLQSYLAATGVRAIVLGTRRCVRLCVATCFYAGAVSLSVSQHLFACCSVQGVCLISWHALPRFPICALIMVVSSALVLQHN